MRPWIIVLAAVLQACAPKEESAQSFATRVDLEMIQGGARFEDDPNPRRTEPPLALFVPDLIDVVCAMLTAPMSESTMLARDAEMNRAES